MKMSADEYERLSPEKRKALSEKFDYIKTDLEDNFQENTIEDIIQGLPEKIQATANQLCSFFTFIGLEPQGIGNTDSNVVLEFDEDLVRDANVNLGAITAKYGIEIVDSEIEDGKVVLELTTSDQGRAYSRDSSVTTRPTTKPDPRLRPAGLENEEMEIDLRLRPVRDENNGEEYSNVSENANIINKWRTSKTKRADVLSAIKDIREKGRSGVSRDNRSSTKESDSLGKLRNIFGNMAKQMKNNPENTSSNSLKSIFGGIASKMNRGNLGQRPTTKPAKGGDYDVSELLRPTTYPEPYEEEVRTMTIPMVKPATDRNHTSYTSPPRQMTKEAPWLWQQKNNPTTESMPMTKPALWSEDEEINPLLRPALDENYRETRSRSRTQDRASLRQSRWRNDKQTDPRLRLSPLIPEEKEIDSGIDSGIDSRLRPALDENYVGTRSRSRTQDRASLRQSRWRNDKKTDQRLRATGLDNYDYDEDESRGGPLRPTPTIKPTAIKPLTTKLPEQPKPIATTKPITFEHWLQPGCTDGNKNNPACRDLSKPLKPKPGKSYSSILASLDQQNNFYDGETSNNLQMQILDFFENYQAENNIMIADMEFEKVEQNESAISFQMSFVMDYQYIEDFLTTLQDSFETNQTVLYLDYLDCTEMKVTITISHFFDSSNTM